MSIKIKNQELKEKLLNVSGVEVPPIVEKSPYIRDKTEYARMTGAQEVLDFWQKKSVESEKSRDKDDNSFDMG